LALDKIRIKIGGNKATLYDSSIFNLILALDKIRLKIGGNKATLYDSSIFYINLYFD
jgi:hypothetical protein